MRRAQSFTSAVLMLLASLPVLAALYFLVSSRIIEHRQWQLFEQGYSKSYSFSLNDVEWIRPGKEIRVQGRLMDLQSFRIHQGRLEVKGLWDEDETLLHERYSRLPVSPANGTGRLPELLITFLFTPVIPSQLHWQPEQFSIPENSFPPAKAAAACSGHFSILLPPPRQNHLM